MIIISYTSPTITISLSLSMWSQFAMQASTCCIPRNQEHISYRSPVIANFLLKFSNFRYHGNRGWSETNFAYTVKFGDPENSLIGAWCKNQEHDALTQKPSYNQFSLKIFKFSLPTYHGNQGQSGVCVNDTVGIAAIENPLLGAIIRNISPIEAQLYPIFC